MNVRKWISNIISVLILVILLLVLFFVVSSKITGGRPKVFGYELMTVLSGSMEPEIKTGSVIAVKPLSDPYKCKVGDVVTYKSLDDPDMLITHRITKVEKSGSSVQYTTKGDSNKTEDPKPVPASHIIGIYADFTIPGLGYVSSFIKSKTGIVCVLIIPGALLILWQMISVFRLISKMEKDSESSKTV